MRSDKEHQPINNPENLYHPDVLIRKIKKHTELFVEITPEDEKKIRRLKKTRRSAFIFSELVKPENQANVTWQSITITDENISNSYTRLYRFLEEKNIPIDDFQKEILAIHNTLIFFKEWSEKPIIIDHQYRDKDEKGAWRRQMQEIFDVQTPPDELEEPLTDFYQNGPFTDYYEANAVRTNSLNALTGSFFMLHINFQKMGIETKFNEKQSTLVKKIKKINKIFDYHEKTTQQMLFINSLHVLIRSIVNSIGSDKT